MLASSEVWIVGAAGAVGEGVVRACLKAGARVVAVDRDGPALERMRRSVPGEVEAELECLVTELGAPSPSALEERLQKTSPAHVVVALGGRPEPQDLQSAGPEEWASAVGDFLAPHLAAARTLLPRIAGGVHLTLMGSAALGAHPHEGLAHLQGAALRALLRVAAEEFPEVAVKGLAITCPVASRRLPRKVESWPDADEIGRAVRSMLEEQDRRGIFEIAERGQRAPGEVERFGR